MVRRSVIYVYKTLQCKILYSFEEICCIVKIILKECLLCLFILNLNIEYAYKYVVVFIKIFKNKRAPYTHTVVIKT